jgi:hypothetical protein
MNHPSTRWSSRHDRAFNGFARFVMGAFVIVLFITHPIATAALLGIYLLIYSFTKP